MINTKCKLITRKSCILNLYNPCYCFSFNFAALLHLLDEMKCWVSEPASAARWYHRLQTACTGWHHSGRACYAVMLQTCHGIIRNVNHLALIQQQALIPCNCIKCLICITKNWMDSFLLWYFPQWNIFHAFIAMFCVSRLYTIHFLQLQSLYFFQ